jgi:hypothetical protein
VERKRNWRKNRITGGKREIKGKPKYFMERK